LSEQCRALWAELETGRAFAKWGLLPGGGSVSAFQVFSVVDPYRPAFVVVVVSRRRCNDSIVIARREDRGKGWKLTAQSAWT